MPFIIVQCTYASVSFVIKVLIISHGNCWYVYWFLQWWCWEGKLIAVVKITGSYPGLFLHIQHHLCLHSYYLPDIIIYIIQNLDEICKMREERGNFGYRKDWTSRPYVQMDKNLFCDQSWHRWRPAHARSQRHRALWLAACDWLRCSSQNPQPVFSLVWQSDISAGCR